MEKTVESPRRWIVLAAYMAVTLACEIQWLAHASVARAAEAFYAGQFDPSSLFNIDFLALLYMLVYLVLSIPASNLIDRRGVRAGVGLGAGLVVVGGIVKAVGARSFTAQIVAQVVLAASQPFIINAPTALIARWFPFRERGLAVGLASLAQYLGFVVALGITPLLVVVDPTSASYGAGMDRALIVYGIISAAAGIAAILLVGNGPMSAKNEKTATAPMKASSIFASRDMRLTFCLFLIGLGVMNALTSMTDAVAGSIGAKDSDGLIGVFMILGGVIGAVLLPALSDKSRRRKPFIVLCAALMIPGTAGLAFVKSINPNAYSWKLVSAPVGAGLSIRENIPHPTFRSAVSGRYEFDFTMAKKGSGEILEQRKYVVVTAPGAESPAASAAGETVDRVVAPGQPLLMDGTKIDDGLIASIYVAALVAAFLFGFAVMSAGPLGFQYAAEVSHPAPEAISQGILLLAGQVSGIAFTALMSVRKNIYLDGMLVLFAVLSVLFLALALALRESPLIVTEAEKYAAE